MMQSEKTMRLALFMAIIVAATGYAKSEVANLTVGSVPESADPAQSPASNRSQEKKAPPADDSRKNVRDRNPQKLTPLDQGKSAQDVELTRNIRKEVTAQKGISINGKNIKIITVDAMVTLRGPVATPEEKQVIFGIACKIAGPDKVKNELEVK